MMASFIPADFHFLRPEWLFAIIPGVILAALVWRGIGAGRNDWRNVVDAHLLRHLAVRDTAGRGKWPVAVLLAGWVLTALAMAGPSWQKVPTPALDRLDPTVIVLSLGQSMDSADQSPSRLVAARHKVEDILNRMRGGQVALIVYTDAPFVASPLTEDGKVVSQMLPELATDLMPVRGNRPDLAIQKAVELLKNTGAPSGRIVLVTDGAGDAPNLTTAATQAAARDGYAVSVIGVGVPAGPPALGANGRPAPLAGMDDTRLSGVARDGGGRFAVLTADSRDLDNIFAKSSASSSGPASRDNDLVADQWVDMGPWLVIGVVLMASLAFRRGWLAVIPLAFALSGGLGVRPASAQPTDFSNPADGLSWQDLWQTPDQKGASAFASGDYASAATRFQDPAWQASALYKAGEHARAAEAYSSLAGQDYNRGNALARSGKLEDAVAAYDAALKADPKDADAAFNRDLVLRALEQQKQQQQNQNKDDKKDQDQKKPDDKSGDSPQNKDQAKNDPQKPGDQKQPKNDPAKNDPAKPDPAKNDQAKNDQGKNDPAKNDPAKPDPAKPDPAKDGQAKNQPAQKPEPPKEPAKPEPPQPAKDAANGKPQDQPPPPPADPAGSVAAKPMTEQQQNREQALRMVPDDPTGLLRARIRSYYSGTTVPVFEDSAR